MGAVRNEPIDDDDVPAPRRSAHEPSVSNRTLQASISVVLGDDKTPLEVDLSVLTTAFVAHRNGPPGSELSMSSTSTVAWKPVPRNAARRSGRAK